MSSSAESAESAPSEPSDVGASSGGGVAFKKRQRSKHVRQKDEDESATAAGAEQENEADDDVAAAIKRAKAKTAGGKPDPTLHTTERVKAEFQPFTHDSTRSAMSATNHQHNAVAENPMDMVFQKPSERDGQVLTGEEALAAQEKSGYAGLASYKPTIEHGREKMKMGPTKLPANVRISCRFDYQPDLCKDWKETGFCGYGDACKFMHDRGDYKSGWQLEKEWEQTQERERKIMLGERVDAEENYEIAADDQLPFACLYCREDFVNPVVTKCEHYFCERCALKHFAKSAKCFVCKEATQGIFNTATKLIKHLAAKAATEAAAAAASSSSASAPEATSFEPIASKTNASSSSGWVIP